MKLLSFIFEQPSYCAEMFMQNHYSELCYDNTNIKVLLEVYGKIYVLLHTVTFLSTNIVFMIV